ncbi:MULTISPECIES: DNA mismatch repair endonuclease MutL [Clostridium]|uniref:DNA mismatch repair protein MutL n=1 Tax=Clostridium perfringens (strain ATCC 13124 / DSM 756 / JCM 1290 / NCIMB 6125 / NCTC 8237 / Type A) TaxID=195103 RepID=MUTL_CLOP1|nr:MULTISPECIES: DNA mismatch repair endonuclease MutL [Clostridium]Q0TRD5.1 RecName: Full=DNA mismatch repair protein MutL [Clostridium perfringens ATCC 13124]ABG84383.1 DNA mismatch repair protein MutL [Clostridium perfringens ATCC 13124]EGT0684774.1 DNA mismatch repair endonuclease MutL [Clostridium perfringens]EGT0687430.1 DNA mismatch repair endonuclease MutL [Clostridium perfringens]EGT0690375.1 DNA mismatch repair endonuclease MutL [Clostridium perfringens]EGT3619906.1 DNA mismatch rep
MNRINILNADTANKIAAGEVVERPSSVVKELVENSLDAGAKNITIEIQNGGESLIKIIDDGSGVHPEDVEKAFNPHATSKIKDTYDIFSINTLGFRGEALPSIASIARVDFKSKVSDFDMGKELVISGGEKESLTDCSMNRGTQIEVRDLFFNVPARKKFLKTTARESALINDLVNRISLANPDVSFKLFNNNKKILNTYGNGKLIDVIRTIYGKSTAENLIYFEEHKDTASVYGFIGNDTLARASRNNQSLFVNKRYVKNRSLTVAVENAFRSFNVTGKFPFFVLFIDTYPELIDVNIHPTKSEIKFKDERFIFKVVFDAVHSAMREYVKDTFTLPEEEEKKFEALKEEVIQESLDEEISTLEKLKENINYKVSEDRKKEEIYSYNPSKDYEAKTEVNIPVDFLSKENQEESFSINNSLENNNFKEGSAKREISYDPILIKNELKDKVSESTSESLERSDYKCNKNEYGNSIEEIIYREAKFPKLRVIGQFNKTYILAEYDSTLYLIDQHAAHEKILFEKYSSDIAKKRVEIQPLMIPLVVTLPTEDYLYYDENKEIFEKAGFKISDFGDNSIRIEEVPYFLDKLNPTELITSMINNLKKMGTGETVEVKYNKIASMSCRAAVKANDVLSILEMENLIEDLRYINDPFHCPHGRPTIIKFTSYELDKKFKRIT